MTGIGLVDTFASANLSMKKNQLWLKRKNESSRRPTGAAARNGFTMKKYITAQDRIGETETLMAALAIVRTAGLELDGKLPILPPEFARYLIAPDSFMLVVPSAATGQVDRPAVANAMRLSRCDALIVQIARPSIGPKKVVVDVGIDGLVPVWYSEYRPCSLDGALHFVPDHDPGQPVFKLTKKGLTSSVDFDVLQLDEH